MVFLSLESPTELHEGFSKVDVQVLVNSLRSFWSRTHGRGTFVCPRRLGPVGQSTQSHHSGASAAFLGDA